MTDSENYLRSVFIFCRDFRLIDNTGLIQALESSNQVIPVFIMTPEQLVKNKYKSDNAVQFMFESLEELDKDLKTRGSKLFYFFGEPHEVIEKLIKSDGNIEAVYVNKDYTPYAVKREKRIEKVCNKNDVVFYTPEDYLLNPVESILTGSGNVYTKYTPYFNKAKKIDVRKPQSNNRRNFIGKSSKVTGQFKGSVSKFYEANEDIAVKGGRKEALKILRGLKKYKVYNKKRDCLSWETTRLSAYIKFGCVSIREVYHDFKKKLGMKNELIGQLYWRDFYFNASYAHPQSFKQNKSYNEKYDKLKWGNSTKYLKAWKDGQTGFPVVDAGMRELNETGFMHNRARLIVSNWLIKLAYVNWERGELYFAQKLVDYDPCVNNGNWQWGSGSGPSASPWFRTFNPWSQGKDYDPDAEYIKQWVPELEDVPADHIHDWRKHHKDYPEVDYPKPVLEYKESREKVLKSYRKALK